MREGTLIQIGNIFILINNLHIINDHQLFKLASDETLVNKQP